ncbi:MAG: cyclic nucleotide-binding domain-containing protein [Deltaproteobacteria bacterium]|nr:cyclic nucleotide-binding domain-containing protein [Deltaproteobacteria bacterium]
MSGQAAPHILKNVAVLLSDIKGYVAITSEMTPENMAGYTLGNYAALEKVFLQPVCRAQEVRPFAGDAVIALFEDVHGGSNKAARAVEAALGIIAEVGAGTIAQNRIGILLGDIVKASVESSFGAHMVELGNIFSAASRLEQLCDFFGTDFLMCRDTARVQDRRDNVVAIGKITPKGFRHPIHVYTLYLPGLHRCPSDVDTVLLADFIALKNDAIDYFSGNALKQIDSDFSVAEKKLRAAAALFYKMTGEADIATQRIMEYINDQPCMSRDFCAEGMLIEEKQGHRPERELSLLAEKLLAESDPELHAAFVADTGWERFFRLEWVKAGARVVTIDDPPDGVYFILRGRVSVLDGCGGVRADLSDGDVFGEMAFFCEFPKRNATVIAIDDVVVLKISNTDFMLLPPTIKAALKKIAEKRL